MIQCVLVGPSQAGGEGVYVRDVFEHPPEGVRYALSQQFHAGNEHARCHVAQEILLNRTVHPFLRYSFGFRVLSVGDDVDLVHVHSLPTKIRSRRRVPVVMSAGSSHYINVRDYEKWSERKIRRRYALARAIYRPLGIHDELLNAGGIARIYTFSDWAREIYVRHGLSRDKIDVVPPGFEVPPAAHGESPDGTVRFLFIGLDFDRKGGPLTVEAFSRLRAKSKNVSLTIVTRDAARVASMEGVTVVPMVDRAELYRTFYPAADVFVMPTEAEGWGFTNAEAMSFGLPVVSTAIGAIPEIVEHGVTGLLIEPGDGEALLGAMSRLAESKALREEMGQRARGRFVSRFARDVFRANLRDFYAKALGS